MPTRGIGILPIRTLLYPQEPMKTELGHRMDTRDLPPQQGNGKTKERRQILPSKSKSIIDSNRNRLHHRHPSNKQLINSIGIEQEGP